MSDNGTGPAKLRFHLDPQHLTFDHLIAMQEGQLRVVRDLMARTLVDENDNPVPFEQAVKLIGSLPITQLGPAADTFREQVLSLNPQISGL